MKKLLCVLFILTLSNSFAGCRAEKNKADATYTNMFESYDQLSQTLEAINSKRIVSSRAIIIEASKYDIESEKYKSLLYLKDVLGMLENVVERLIKECPQPKVGKWIIKHVGDYPKIESALHDKVLGSFFE